MLDVVVVVAAVVVVADDEVCIDVLLFPDGYLRNIGKIQFSYLYG